jgi:hypothetical protein
MLMYGHPDIYGATGPVFNDPASHAGALALEELYGATGGPGGFPGLGGRSGRDVLLSEPDDFLDDEDLDWLFFDDDDDEVYALAPRDWIGEVPAEEYEGLGDVFKAIGKGLGTVGKGIGKGVVGIGKGIGKGAKGIGKGIGKGAKGVGKVFKKKGGGGGGGLFKKGGGGGGGLFKKKGGGGGGKKFKPFAWMKPKKPKGERKPLISFKRKKPKGERKGPFSWLKRRGERPDASDLSFVPYDEVPSRPTDLALAAVPGAAVGVDQARAEARVAKWQQKAGARDARLARKERKMVHKARKKAFKRALRGRQMSEFQQQIADEMAHLAAPSPTLGPAEFVPVAPSKRPEGWRPGVVGGEATASFGYMGNGPVYPRTPPGTVPALDPGDYANPYDDALNIYPGRYLSR